jgi:dolichyl-phosphate beta-glucosyltransferase
LTPGHFSVNVFLGQGKQTLYRTFSSGSNIRLQDSSTLSLSIIIPAYNEERRIGRCLESLLSYVNKKKWDYELIVVEDGSTDKTRSIVTDFNFHDKRVKLLSLPAHLGKGGSISSAALLAVTKEFVAYMDVDLAAEPPELERLLDYITDYDIVIGSRILRGDLPPVKRPIHRSLFSHLYSKLFRSLFRIPIYDPQCGLKLFRSEITEKLLNEINIAGFAFDTDIIVKAFYLGLRLKEVPINWTHGKSSTLNVITEIRSMALDLFSIWYDYHLLWKKNGKSYSQKRGSIWGKALFALLSINYEIRNRKLRYSKFREFIAQTSIVKGIKSN